jgi:hypothetical protein
MVMNYIDKVFILAIVLHGFNRVSQRFKDTNKVLLYGSIATFLSTILLFYAGYYFGIWCYDKDEQKRMFWHSFLHVLSSVGHHMIVFM